MYKIYCDGSLMWDPRNEDLAIINPVLTLEDSCAGSMTFTLPPSHPFYDVINRRSSIIEVRRDDQWLWSGFVQETTDDFWKRRKFDCVGELSYLSDTIQPQKEYRNVTIRSFLQGVLTEHNLKSDRDFQVGAVTVTDPNDAIYRFTNRENTLHCIKDKLLDRLGGHFRIRHDNGDVLLDYLKDYPRTSRQVIDFGKNLLDFASNIDMSEIATVIVPLGAKQGDSTDVLEKRLTIESVNDGKEYLKSDDAVAEYGWIERVVTWDDVTVAANLKTKGQAYLNDIQYESMVLTVSAVDLHNLDVDIDTIDLLDEIRVVSRPHGLDRLFPVTKKTIPLDKPSQEKLTLGTEVHTSMTETTMSVNQRILQNIENIPSVNGILEEARENATEIIRSALNGYVVITDDASELLIMNTPDIRTATKVWRFNINGLGYSNTGYQGPFGLALTMDGSIVADFVNVGTLRAIMIQGPNGTHWDLQSGEFTNYGETDVTAQVETSAGVYTPTTYNLKHITEINDGIVKLLANINDSAVQTKLFSLGLAGEGMKYEFYKDNDDSGSSFSFPYAELGFEVPAVSGRAGSVGFQGTGSAVTYEPFGHVGPDSIILGGYKNLSDNRDVYPNRNPLHLNGGWTSPENAIYLEQHYQIVETPSGNTKEWYNFKRHVSWELCAGDSLYPLQWNGIAYYSNGKKDIRVTIPLSRPISADVNRIDFRCTVQKLWQNAQELVSGVDAEGCYVTRWSDAGIIVFIRKADYSVWSNGGSTGNPVIVQLTDIQIDFWDQQSSS